MRMGKKRASSTAMNFLCHFLYCSWDIYISYSSKHYIIIYNLANCRPNETARFSQWRYMYIQFTFIHEMYAKEASNFHIFLACLHEK